MVFIPGWVGVGKVAEPIGSGVPVRAVSSSAGSGGGRAYISAYAGGNSNSHLHTHLNTPSTTCWTSNRPARAHYFLLALPLPRSNLTRYKYPAQSYH